MSPLRKLVLLQLSATMIVMMMTKRNHQSNTHGTSDGKYRDFVFMSNNNYIFLCFYYSYSDTPTSSGPNSFGKTKQGFCDVKKIFEKTLREYSTD